MSHSVISLGLGLGGGKPATSSGRLAGGGGALSNILSSALDGTNDSIVTTYEPTSAETISFTMWIKTSNTTDSIGFISNQTSGGVHNIAFLSSSSTKSFFTIMRNSSSGGNTLINGIGGSNSTLDVRDGDWHHLAFTINGTSVKIYKDGGDAAINSGSPTNTQGTAWGTWTAGQTFDGRSQPFYIGTNGALVSGNAYYFDGLMDEVGIFQSELSGSDVSSIYNEGVPGDLTDFSPAAWYRMGDGTGDTNSGGGTPANGDTIGTVADQAVPIGSANATGQNGSTYSNDVPS
jgi:hypothetical protein